MFKFAFKAVDARASVLTVEVDVSCRDGGINQVVLDA